MKYNIESIEKRRKTIKNIKRVVNIVLIILVYNIVLLFISSINRTQNINIFRYKSYIITTNSMEPSIKVGDVVVTKSIKEKDLKEGDVITFRDNQEVITHRIVKIDNVDNMNYYITKGDNNNVEDQKKVVYSEIEGKSILIIPGLGKFIGILENKIMVLAILLVVLIICFWKIKIEEKRDSRREKKKIEEEKKIKN